MVKSDHWKYEKITRCHNNINRLHEDMTTCLKRWSLRRASTRPAGLWGTPPMSSLAIPPLSSFDIYRCSSAQVFTQWFPTTLLLADPEQHLGGEQQHHRLPRPRRHHGHLHAEHVIQSGTNSCSGIHKISLEILSECCQTNDKKVTLAKHHWTVKSLLTPPHVFFSGSTSFACFSTWWGCSKISNCERPQRK